MNHVVHCELLRLHWHDSTEWLAKRSLLRMEDKMSNFTLHIHSLGFSLEKAGRERPWKLVIVFQGSQEIKT